MNEYEDEYEDEDEDYYKGDGAFLAEMTRLHEQKMQIIALRNKVLTNVSSLRNENAALRQEVADITKKYNDLKLKIQSALVAHTLEIE